MDFLAKICEENEKNEKNAIEEIDEMDDNTTYLSPEIYKLLELDNQNSQIMLSDYYQSM